MNTCDSCRFWKRITKHRRDVIPPGPLLGDCESPGFHHGYDLPNDENVDGTWKLVTPSTVLVENDEGWAFVTGPKFGCVHWESTAERRNGGL